MTEEMKQKNLSEVQPGKTSHKRRIAVAVDGPAGAGKSSVSKAVAKRLGYLYIDTGAMYRAVTVGVLQQQVNPADGTAVEKLLPLLQLRMEPAAEGFVVFLGDQDVTDLIRSREVNENVSLIATYKGVRQYLVELQRRMAMDGGVILDGRDIGSVVLPQAELKIYLTASPEARAKRRWLEIRDQQPQITLGEVEKNVIARDEMDQSRKESPLVCVPDAVVIDSGNMTFDETVNCMVELVLETMQHE